MRSLGIPSALGVRIRPQKNVIDDGFLDLIGREFSTHDQGLAEWLKNASDATIRADHLFGRDIVFLRFTDGMPGVPSVFECIDFVGMTQREIETQFKPWGKLSRTDEELGRFGGYGMGGKFYMRQMFESSYLMTFSQGRFTVFGFQPSHRYGYGHGYRDRRMKPEEALRFAGMDRLAELAGLRDAVIAGRRGFSVLQGLGPRGIGKEIDVRSLCEALKNHSQAQRPLQSLQVRVVHNGAIVFEELKPRSIPRKIGFEKPWVRRIPERLPLPGGTGRVVRLYQNSGLRGDLHLFVSGESLLRQGRMTSLNRIDFLGREGVIASYRIEELGAEVPYGDSIFGTCDLSGLGRAEKRYGKKTRDALIDRPETRALLAWVREQIVHFSHMIGKKLSCERKGSLENRSCPL